MLANRSSARRLCLTALEDRTAPAVLDGTGITLPDPAPGGVVITSTDGSSTPAAPADTDLSVLLSADKPKPSLGDVVTVKVTVADGSPTPASGVTVGVTLPAGLTFVSATTPSGAYDSASGSWAVGAVAPGTPAVLTLKLKVTDVAAQQVTAAVGHADQPDSKADNNSANLTVTPQLAGLTLTKTVSGTTVVVGSTVVFTLAVRNTGPGAASAITVTDTLPAGLQLVKYQPSHGSVSTATQTWTIPSLPAGWTATLRVYAVVKQVGRFDAPAALTGASGFDPARSQTAATAAVTGTRVNNPTTWSYAAPGFRSAPVPVAGMAKLSQPPVTPVATVAPATPVPTTPKVQKVTMIVINNKAYFRVG